jgi:hypothetical protein
MAIKTKKRVHRNKRIMKGGKGDNKSIKQKAGGILNKLLSRKTKKNTNRKSTTASASPSNQNNKYFHTFSEENVKRMNDILRLFKNIVSTKKGSKITYPRVVRDYNIEQEIEDLEKNPKIQKDRKFQITTYIQLLEYFNDENKHILESN